MGKKKRKIILEKGDKNMNAVADLRLYKEEKETQASSYSVIDIILDITKKEEQDNYIKQNYEYIEKDDFAKKMFGKNKDEK